ncbi:glycerol kinase GlpK [Methylocapsa palsarum]|uniref:Glycerol kinase n=1 Tax=Methylocapsa palsarum TaxID=1612308 RepID=A0A1I3XHZ3_9HYPH|nr:glycerol kinase GlpK [Methylocapsa palsarum]SFK18686.1 glycerol kinase [Methylocapsa palsarum]
MRSSGKSASPVLLAIDQGTTSTRSLLFDVKGRRIAAAQRELAQYYPRDGWVEQELEDIWRDALGAAREVMSQAAAPVAALGIANQRETVAIWDRATGTPIHRAIVWQDRRTAADCEALRAGGAEDLVRSRTGLLLDPYFSATKIAWILDHVPGARQRAERGELAFGTIDAFLLWRLTGGATHATDATNASRTLLFDIHRQRWDEDLLDLFRVPAALLPGVCDSSGLFGVTAKGLFPVQIPITGMAGDQQAALIGQACFTPGLVKSTYGTGCFALLNTGHEPAPPRKGLLTTVAYRIDGVPAYAVEGAIFAAGAAVKWLRDGLGLIKNAADTARMAASVETNLGVYMVPAFVGLGAPHWDPAARGLICGLTLDATGAHIARAALESVAYQTLDLMEAITACGPLSGPQALRVDGGMASNDWFCQFLADILDAPVERPAMLETTALGAAYLAGMSSGVFSDFKTIGAAWSANRRFEPQFTPKSRAALIEGWRRAVRRAAGDAPNT